MILIPLSEFLSGFRLLDLGVAFGITFRVFVCVLVNVLIYLMEVVRVVHFFFCFFCRVLCRFFICPFFIIRVVQIFWIIRVIRLRRQRHRCRTTTHHVLNPETKSPPPDSHATASTAVNHVMGPVWL